MAVMVKGDEQDWAVDVERDVIDATPREEQDPEGLAKHMAFMRTVVEDEDYTTGANIQRALATGAKDELMFGRNEGGGQLFHRWVEAVVEASDDELPALLERGVGELGTP